MKLAVTPGRALDYTGCGASVIPARKNRKDTSEINSLAYNLRNRVERAINRLKNATRYDKTAHSYLGCTHILSERLWFKCWST